MEIVDFYPTAFNDIPNQDNPAFDATEECLMLVADNEITKYLGWTTVLHIVPDIVESVNRVAVFCDHAVALNFCKTFNGSEIEA